MLLNGLIYYRTTKKGERCSMAKSNKGSYFYDLSATKVKRDDYDEEFKPLAFFLNYYSAKRYLVKRKT